MLAIIGERPNLNPTGLGNSGTPIDLSILTKPSSRASSPLTVNDDEDVDDDIDSDGREEQQLHVQSHALDSDDDVTTPSSEFTGKRKHSPDIKPKQGPKPGKSQKSTRPAPRKGFNPMDRFAELSREEEATAQKRLKLKQERLDMEKELQKEKIRVAGETKVEKMKVLAELEVKKMQMAHEQEYRMKLLERGQARASDGQFHSTPAHRNFTSTQSSGMGFHNFSDGLQTPGAGSSNLFSLSTGPSTHSSPSAETNFDEFDFESMQFDPSFM